MCLGNLKASAELYLSFKQGNSLSTYEKKYSSSGSMSEIFKASLRGFIFYSAFKRHLAVNSL